MAFGGMVTRVRMQGRDRTTLHSGYCKKSTGQLVLCYGIELPGVTSNILSALVINYINFMF